MFRSRARACALLLAAFSIGCETSINPATGRREVVLMSAADERQIDAQAALQIEAQMGLVRDEGLADYVERVGQTLAIHSPRQDVIYSFQIVEMEAANAFALPGGHIYVSRGLLTVTNSEAELANVLGHEIGHVAARHAARQDAHQKTLGLSTVMSEVMSGKEESAESERISGHFVARYARNQEREADRIGQQLAEDAGIDPLGMARFLSTLDNLTKLDLGFSMPQTYFSTHPAIPERVAEATTAAQLREWRAAGEISTQASRLEQPDRDVFLDAIEGMAVTRPASEGVFQDDLFLHPDLGFSLRFPPGWHTENQTAQVLGIAPRRDAIVLLQLEGEGDDPEAAARDFATREGLVLTQTQTLVVRGQPAFRARSTLETGMGPIEAEVTWIALDGTVYRLVAGMQPGATRKYRGLFRRFAHSFGPITEDERRTVTELRLRTGRAREGETLSEFGRRTGNEWDLTFTAVANATFVDEPLREGQRLKIAVREPYRTAPEPPADDAEPDVGR